MPQGDTVALVMLSGVQYLNGQFFDIASITAAGHKVVRVKGSFHIARQRDSLFDNSACARMW